MTKAYAAVCALVRFGMTDQLAFDVELVLMASDIPELKLTEAGACWLGWSTWLGPLPQHDVSVVFPEAVASGSSAWKETHHDNR